MQNLTFCFYNVVQIKFFIEKIENQAQMQL